MRKKIIVFDFDGVIVQSLYLVIDMMRYFYGEMVTEQYYRSSFCNGNVSEELKKLGKRLVTDEERLRHIQDVYIPGRLALLPVEGIKDVLGELSKDFILVINTSSTAESVAEYLEAHDLSEYFDSIYGTEISSKKDEKFNMILEKFDATCSDTIFITDTLGDVVEANICNIPSIVVLWGYQEKEHLTSCTVMVQNPMELIAAIKSHVN